MDHIDMEHETIMDLPQPNPIDYPGLHLWQVPVCLGEHSYMAAFIHDFLDNWLKQNDGPAGTPVEIFKILFGTDYNLGNISHGDEVRAHKFWCEKIVMMRDAFKLILTTDSYDRTDQQQKAIDDGLLEFARWFEALWD
jgi:hypothetical protein